MKRYLAKRLGLSFLALVFVCLLVFLLIHIIPGDPVEQILGEASAPADRENLRKLLGLNLPLIEQFWNFLKNIANGTLGVSFSHNRPVLALMLEKFPATLLLSVSGLVVALLLSIPLATFAAIKRGRWQDILAMTFAMFGMSLPIFVVAPLMILFFSIRLGWFPVAGYGGFEHLIMPSLCLGLGLTGVLSRMLRASLLDVFSEDFIRMARAKGLSEVAVVCRHALRNALIPVVTLLGNMLGALLAGAVLTETIFDWPGIGKLFFSAFQSRDYPLIQGLVLWISTSYIIINLLVDFSYVWIDPRVSFDAGEV